MTGQASRGWDSNFPTFTSTGRDTIMSSLVKMIPDASPEQIRAWKESIPPLQNEASEVLGADPQAKRFSAILEYVMPMESRRPDCIFLIDGAILVLELKGKSEVTQADIDQVAAYARDLKCYHRDCADRPVHALLVPTKAKGFVGTRQGIFICGPDAVDDLVSRLDRDKQPAIPVEKFLEEEAYRPLPTLVAAARELFTTNKLRRVHKAAAATEPTVTRIRDIAREAARTKTRKLILLTGVPGAGKTLVGLHTVHGHWLDELAIDRGTGKPPAPGVFLSGNGPLVEVLQYELRDAGGGGKLFVRGVKDYIKRYSGRANLTPPEHVLVFDEAQRAFDRAMVAYKHDIPIAEAKSEPELFIEFAERIPEWCVVVGLIGGGQEIHKGEEGGIRQWRNAIAASPGAATWTVHAPSGIANLFEVLPNPVVIEPTLNLDRELRFHLAKNVHRFVAQVLEGNPAVENAAIAQQLNLDGYHFRITRDFAAAREYLQKRYKDEPERRFGLIASSKDKGLKRFRIYNDYQSTKRVKFGPWYGDAEDHPARHSCRLLEDCVTEFGAQGLELDAALMAWGTDFRKLNGKWSTGDSGKYDKSVEVRDPYQLRLNSYRVLLTRGREATVIFVPPVPEMDETFEYLVACGVTGV